MCALVTVLGLSGARANGQQAMQQNDDLFPPGTDAAQTIQFDGKGLLIEGRRTFLVSGSVHYPRVPREQWRDVLLKMKRAGFNTVQTYVFWNYHEAKEGEFDFSRDSHDLGAFLDTAKSVGLYAIVRVGPYSCAEWENGGFPTWLYFKPGMEVRKDNAAFLQTVDHWFSRMLPIVAERQIFRGGNVILVQLENEQPGDHWKYWGTAMDGAYDLHLLELARKSGLQVPMFFSGLHHGHDPAPQAPVQHAGRKSPWLSTELWTTWFDRYGVNAADLKDGERHAWRILAEGGNGFNLYMFHGGTTFEYNNFNEDRKWDDNREKASASYDYGTLVGQTGNITELYYRLKRLAYFADSYTELLADSDDASTSFKDFALGVAVTARTGPEGSLVFLDNKGEATTAVFKDGERMQLAAGEIVGLPVATRLREGIQLTQAESRILGVVQQGRMTTLVCYGDNGEQGEITFNAAQSGVARIVHNARFDWDGGRLKFQFSSDGVGEERIQYGDAVVRVLVMDAATADKTWFVEANGDKEIIVGAPYLGEYTEDAGGRMRAELEYPLDDVAPKEVQIYGGRANRTETVPQVKSEATRTIGLEPWMMHVNDEPLAMEMDDSHWYELKDGNPAEMGQDGDRSAYSWYRVSLDNSSTVTGVQFARIGDRATFFVDGKLAGTFDFKKDKSASMPLKVQAGSHELAVFVAHAGRQKFSGYVGSLDKLDAQKGLRGPVTILGDSTAKLSTWKMRGGVDPLNPTLQWGNVGDTHGAPAYFRTEFMLQDHPERGTVYRLSSDGLSYGSVWLNGHNVGRYPEIIKGCPGIWLPSVWMKPGKNQLVILDELGRPPSRVQVQIEAAASRINTRISWRRD
jgi:beta-galactosidase